MALCGDTTVFLSDEDVVAEVTLVESVAGKDG